METFSHTIVGEHSLFPKDQCLDNEKNELTEILDIKKTSSNLERCWICFDDILEGLNDKGSWRSPCRCGLIGHEKCLLTWITESQKTDLSDKPVLCPQCKCPLRLKDSSTFTFWFLSKIDKVLRKSVPIFIVCGLGSSALISAAFYGIHTIYTICGEKDAQKIMEFEMNNEYFWKLAFGLPSIPFILIFSQFSQFDTIIPIIPLIFFGDQALDISRPLSPTFTLCILPWIRIIYNSIYRHFIIPIHRRFGQELYPQREISGYYPSEHQSIRQTNTRTQENEENHDIRGRMVVFEDIDFGRMIVGTLMFPKISSIIGSCIMKIPGAKKWIPSKFHCSVIGGCLFIVLKDAISLFYKYQKVKQRRSRRVLNYNENLDI
ncbi:hypothetical protein PNEG_00733 [Pneumocystis murina B123]|uniref:RING-CH-type domain-containing protein n=1 Tax=Pneumocystis murina (strain B123) TaxID=1069680 RepID=M7NV09_PNEMU|nr:hypothetical protein PNEG_00733 [Pneumocystis murina B123]EMR11137.1 hypothetical protein PNEG_00733 [Pneumocystis murina B123]